jgi:hypothetical protein
MSFYSSNLSLNDITKNIKGNKGSDYPTIKINKSFLQTHDIPINLVSTETIQEVVESSKNLKLNGQIIRFIPDELLEMPNNFSDFLDLNKYYIYGCSNLLESLIYILDTNYKLENSSSKRAQLEEFYLSVLEKLNVCFQTHKDIFNKNKLKRTTLEKKIKDIFINSIEIDNNERMDICHVISNIYNLNIVYLDLTKKLYRKYDYNYDNNIVILDYDNKLVPLIHIYGELLSNIDIDNILVHYKMKINLKKITNYSLIELQDMAQQNNIDIIINSKNKTKSQLYDDLSVLS